MAASRILLAGILGIGVGLLAGYFSWHVPVRDAQGLVERTSDERQFVDVTPSDFAFLPCPRAGERGVCVVIAAGGKRVLVGAPAGIGAPPPSGEGWLGGNDVPDAILLFSLDASQIEGLDEIRSRIWETGLSQLPLIGGEGIEEISTGLDQTYIVPDAVAYVRRRRQRGFEKNPFATRIVRHGDIAFDTGDLTISALSGGAGQLAFHIEYGGQSAVLSDCSTSPESVTQWPEADHYLACWGPEEVAGLKVTASLPLETAVFILGPDTRAPE